MFFTLLRTSCSLYFPCENGINGVRLVTGTCDFQVFIGKMLIAVKLNCFHFAARAFFDLIQHGHAARWVSLNMALNFRVEKAFCLEVRRQVLRAFIDQIRINSIFLVHGDKFFLGASPHVRSRQFDLDSWPFGHVILNVSPVGFRVIKC